MDPYKILELSKNFTLEDLKKNYKRIALRTHPDKSGLQSDYLFKLVTQAYKALLQEYERRQEDKPFDQLREQSQTFVDSQTGHNGNLKRRTGGGFGSGSGSSFNLKMFNEVFDEYKITEDEDAVGYGDWMEKSSPIRQELDVQKKFDKFDNKKFNHAFDAQPTSRKKAVAVYSEPQALPTCKSIAFSEIGVSHTADFSGDNISHKSLQFTDYKVAHTTTRLVDSKTMKKRKDYKDLHELEAARSSISFAMSPQDLQEQAKRKAREAATEQKRLENVRKKDEQIMRQHEMLNRLLLGK